MTTASACRATTFKPPIDKWTAHDGARVVLWADAIEALVLSFHGGRWEVTRHPAIDADALPTPSSMEWQGVRYAASGERVASFTSESSPEEWQRFYADCLRSQEQRSSTRDGHCSAAM